MFNFFQAMKGWFRFRLNTLLALFVLAALVAAWSAREHRQSQRQHEIARELEKGGSVTQIGGPFDVINVKPSDQPWHSRVLGTMFFGPRVTGLSIGFEQEPSELGSIGELSDLHTVVVIPRSERERASTDDSAYDLSFLSSCRKIVQLNVDSKPIRDLTPLAGLTRLQVLGICSSQITDAGPLTSLTNLQQLDLSHSPLVDLAFVTRLKQLKILGLQMTRVEDLAPLAGLPDLETLILRDTPVSDVKPLASLSNLKTLRLDGTRVTDLSPLAGLQQLERLSLSNTAVRDYTPLIGLRQSRELAVEKDSIDSEQLERLKQALPNCRVRAI